MDLSALRLAALGTKKRKRAQQQHTTLAPVDGEKEEGEIDDSPPPPPLPPPTAPKADRTPQHTLPTPVSVPPAQAGSAASSSSQALHAIKEESKAIIAELLTYGVPPDYLLSIGVSHDILEISFHELNLPLTLPPATTPSPALAPLHQPHSSLQASTSTLSPTFSPAPIAAIPPPRPPSTAEDLAALEASKRAELLARKAALKARNQLGAQSLESELDNLFSSALSAAPSSVSPAPADVDEPDRKRPKLRTTASALHDLRASIEETEETVDVPDAGPFSPATTANGFGADSVVLSSLRMNGASAPPRRRPVAADLEAEPIAKLSAQALGAQRGPAFLPRAETSMIIDLSDDEDDEDDEAERGDSEMADGTVSVPSRAKSKIDSPTAAFGASVANGASADDARKRQLEEKDRELQMLKERIAAMEKKRQAPKSRMSSAEPLTAEAAPVLKDPGRGAEREKIAEEEAAEAEEVTVDAIRAIVETAGMAEPSPHTAASPDIAPLSVSEISLAPPVPSAPSVFRPYTSSLSRFPLIRSSAFDSNNRGSPSSSDNEQVSTNAGSAGVASWAARKHGVDTSKRLCKAETSGGKCADAKCKSVHVAAFVPTAEELDEFEQLRPSPVAVRDSSA